MRYVYSKGQKEETKDWLEKHEGTRTVLRQLATVIPKFFPGASVRLEVRIDPEAGPNRYLGLYIQTRLSARSAVDRLTALDARWGDWVQDMTDGMMFLNVEAKRPVCTASSS